MSVKVFFKDKRRWDTKMTLPYVGAVTISQEGTFEHKDEDAVKQLCGHLPQLVTTEEDDKNKPVVGQLQTKKDYIKMLTQFTMAQLKETAAADESLAPNEWKPLQKKQLIEYLAVKLFAQQAENGGVNMGAPQPAKPAAIGTQTLEDDDKDPDDINED